MVKQLLKNCATLGIIGYLPAPGTMATISTIIGLFFLQSVIVCQKMYVICLALVFIFSWFAIDYIVKKNMFQTSDPSEIVLDEVVGTLITFVGIAINLKMLAIGFLLFRFFDIAKPFGIKKLERYNGAFGIISDDVVAGLLSNILLHTILFIFGKKFFQ